MNPKNFFAELKRRNVYKVAVGYGAIHASRKSSLPLASKEARQTRSE
jgi:hypothetical protein